MLGGAASSSHNIFSGLDIKKFTTTINVSNGASNRLDCNYANVLTGGTMFSISSSAYGNHFIRCDLVQVGVNTISVIYHQNSWNELPNRFESFYIAIDSGGTANAINADGSTQIVNVHGYNDGTLSSLLAFNVDDSTISLTNKRIYLTDRTTYTKYEIYVDNSVFGIETV